MRTIVVGSRGSRLALRQAHWVKERLEERGRTCRIEVIRTSGDRFVEQSLAAIGGKGVFVKEIEDALLEGRIDLAVHSLKDLPTTQPDRLAVVCVPQREDPRDLLVSRDGARPEALRRGAVVGTGSPRRACQIRALRADLGIRDLRGNVDTRLRRLAAGDYDAIVLAAAGVRRLGEEVRACVFTPDEMVPAVGQGALAIEGRVDDNEIAAVVAPLHHPPTSIAVTAERAFLRALGGGCQAPIAALGEARDGRLLLRGLVADPGGEQILKERREDDAADPEGAGAALATALLARGAAQLLALTAPPPGRAP